MMSREEVFEGLKEVLHIIRPNTDLSKVSPETELVRELGIDSLSMMLLSLAVEEKFKFRFPDGQAPFRTAHRRCFLLLLLYHVRVAINGPLPIKYNCYENSRSGL